MYKIVYCNNCGNEVSDQDAYCSRCGHSLRAGADISQKSRLVAGILAWFLGVFGIHRFYVGRICSGVFMILTFGGLGFWALIDAIVVLCGEFKDCDGKKLRIWLD